jgi:hypothetical protein
LTEFRHVAARRRAILGAGLAAAAAGGLAVPAAQAQQKLAQNLIMYQDTPKDGQRCDQCTHWQPPNACAIVEGPIAPAGWCGAFAPKT